MKKIASISSLVLYLIFGSGAFGQAPQKFDYQAIVRDGNGVIISDQNVVLQFSIHDQSPSGTIVYQETQQVQTNQFGLVTLSVGDGTPLIGVFSDIDWGAGGKYLRVEMDRSGGANLVELGNTQLISVPYALYASNAGNPGVPGPTGPIGPQGPAGVQGIPGPTGPLLGASFGQTLRHDSTQWVANSFLFNDGNKIGINTSNPSSTLHVENGAVLFSGSAGTTPVAGSGMRFMWVPFKGAIRSGGVDNNQWDDLNIGSFSAAFGSNCLAYGSYSSAFGNQNSTIGAGSFIGGFNSTSIADYSFLYGKNLVNNSFLCAIVGSFNDTTGIAYHSSTGYAPTDPLFVVANGTGMGDNIRSNAITVLKNGNSGFSCINPLSTIQVNGSFAGKTRLINSDGPIRSDDFVILGNAVAGNLNLQLPSASSSPGRIYFIKKIDNSLSSITLICQNTGDLIDGAASFVLLSPYSYVQVISDGLSNWYIINN